MGDKLEDWAAEAKKEGLEPLVAKWAFRLARARAKVALADRALKIHEQDLINLSFRAHSVGVVPPTEEQLNDAAGALRGFRDVFAEATELAVLAELVLELCQRPSKPALAAVPKDVPSLGVPKKGGARFGSK